MDEALYEAWRSGQEWLGSWLAEQTGEPIAARTSDEEAAADGAVVEDAPSRRDALCMEIGLAQGAADIEIVARLTRLASAAAPPTRADAGRLARVRALLDRHLPPTEPRVTHVVTAFPCAVCGEPNEIDIDLEEGAEQAFTVDCWVCCRPNGVHVRLDGAGVVAAIDATLEQF
jgi:hypothetical protein